MKSKKTVVKLSGDLTVQQAADQKKNFEKTMAGKKPVVLDFGKVTAVDLSFLQIVLSATRSDNSIKDISIQDPTGRFMQTVEASGLASQFHNQFKIEKTIGE